MAYACNNGHMYADMPDDALCSHCGEILLMAQGGETQELPSASPMQILEDVSLVINNQPRCPTVLLVDTSGSMFGSKIDQVNRGIQILREEILKDSLASKRVELAIITFNNTATLAQDFATVDQYRHMDFAAGGATHMATAIHKAFDTISSRRKQYRKHNTECYKPMLFLLTDGAPTDDRTLVQQAAARVRKEEKEQVVFFPIGVGSEADMDFLNRLSKRGARKLEEAKFMEFFAWIKDSLSSVSSSNPGDKVALPPVDGWSSI